MLPYSHYLFWHVGFTLQNNLYHTPLRTEQILAKILPGDKKAILHTSNGNSLVLSGDTFSLTEINGTQISSTQDEGIVYTPQTTNNTIKIYNTLVVPLKGEYNITLCDGTQVWLNSSSSFEVSRYLFRFRPGSTLGR